MRFDEWFGAKKLDLSDWTDLRSDPTCEAHLWRAGEGGYQTWPLVTDDYWMWEFRECVLCKTQQIREQQS